MTCCGGENRAISAASASCTGMRVVNIVPCPKTLSTERLPPINSTNRWLMVSPNPVPPGVIFPTLLCTNASKMASISLSAMPTPVSSTSNTRDGLIEDDKNNGEDGDYREMGVWRSVLVSLLCSLSHSIQTRNVICPFSVNLIALLSKLIRI